ncbi:MAG TPA: beta-propeller fold lactonase family protein [Candidatus Polarisedimenticolia bacterium]|jgi:6-phosphogluconolactonase|nr:beta-propeller fold lactonase family protein [Candidatus Polarisedimenticolia bacterium]
MKALFTITLLFIMALFSGCLGSSKSSTAPNLAFAYMVGQGDNGIHAFAEKTTGDLQALPVFTFPTTPRPVSIALHPSKNFLYVPNLTSNTVSGFNIDHASGVLTPIGTALPPTPACVSPAVCSNPTGVCINSGGQLLFLLNQGSTSPAVPASISVFSIDPARGLLTPVAGSPFAFASLVAPNPQFLAVSPTAGFLYVSNGSSGTISAFSIGSSGALTEIGSAVSVAPSGPVATVAGLAIDAKGQFLYAADSANNKIASFSIGGGGTLTAVGSPFAAGTKPVAVAVDSTSSFLYSANQGSSDVSAFKITSGALTQLPGSPYAVEPAGSVGAPQPSFLTVDVSNTFLYVANFGSSSVSAFGIKSSDGTLGLITNSPFVQGFAPLWIVTTQ